MTLVIAAMIAVFVLTCFASTKKLVAFLAIVALYYIHLPLAIGLTLILAVFFYYA